MPSSAPVVLDGIALDRSFLEKLLDISCQAGDAIMEIYATDFDVETKGDDSPVTAADKAADDLIREALVDQITDAWTLVTEETFEGEGPEVGSKPFWLIDPLDGTKEFVKRNGEFTVNIALIVEGRPVAGCVHAPAVGKTYVAGPEGAFRVGKHGGLEPIRVRPVPDAGLSVLVSRSHPAPEVGAYLKTLTVAEEVTAGSSLKFCLVAEGIADLYPRFGPTMEWDTAAGHAVLMAAGGRVTDRDDIEISYGKPAFKNPGFIAKG
ncbi:MAG: 3'(2'),5'-bisphosphate nucleotidase CysQ [Magnetovibrionaceae bacterium]